MASGSAAIGGAENVSRETFYSARREVNRCFT